MRIAIDLDGVVINLIDAWLDRINAKSDAAFTRHDITRFDFGGIVGLDDRSMYSHLTPDIYEVCTPEPGAERGLLLLDAMAEKPLIIVSKSSGKADFESAKTAWLKRYFPSVNFEFRYVRSGEPKHPKLADCDLFIDDYEANFEGVTCRCVLFDQPWNRHVTGYRRAVGWRGVIEAVSEHQQHILSGDAKAFG